MRIWLAIILGTALSLAVLWLTGLPLGIPGEWTWKRSSIEPDTLWNLVGGVVASGLFAGFMLLGRRRFEAASGSAYFRIESTAWLCGLVVVSFIWLWIVQEISPVENRLGKAPFVLYYASSSGYFTRARYEQTDPQALLAQYENLMREGDVLHTGTHPPGLFLVFHGLIRLCQQSPQLRSFLESTQTASFREACDVIEINVMRGRNPGSFLPSDRQVLWLATLLVMLAAALTVVPLYGLLLRTCSSANAFCFAALWPAMPAVAIFVPKSDVAFPLFGVLLLWLWRGAWDRRSQVLAFLAGAMTWCSLICSLAFLPCVLVAALSTLGEAIGRLVRPARRSITVNPAEESESPIGFRRYLCIISAAVGFLLPTFLLWIFLQINMLNVWRLNYQNHAGFYLQYPRTYWKWLLVNPLELMCAAGWPLALLAMMTCWRVLLRGQTVSSFVPRSRLVSDVGSIVFVWGLLWITGKNSGEAARLWIVFLPWLNWLASIQFEWLTQRSGDIETRQHQAAIFSGWQFAACLLTVMRISGFHHEGG